MRASRGFTLIEIMVVLIIMSIVFGFVLLSFGDFGQSRRLLMASEQFANTLRLAEQQAILESSTLGLMLKQNSYQIYRYQAPEGWKMISNRGIFGPQHFPEGTSLHMAIAQQSKTAGPDIIVNASGDITPFKLTIGTEKNPSLTTLTGRHDGQLIFSQTR